MSTSEFDEYKVEHLFLLIGENPLPNYVAAKLLLNKGGKPLLVFSEGTKESAKRFKEELDLSDNQMVPLDNNEANAYEIKRRIIKKIKEIQQEVISKQSDKNQFGLNYTGGTKAMAAHAYQALLDAELNPHPIFSYLDSSSLKMLIDWENGNPIPLNIPKEPLELSLEKLFKLHGLSLSENKASKSNIKTDVTLPELVEAIVKNNSSWREWCKTQISFEGRNKEEVKRETKSSHREEKSDSQKNIETEIYFNFKGWKKADELRELSLPIEELAKDIIVVLQKSNFLDKQGRLSIQQIETVQEEIEREKRIPKPKKSKEYPEDICKWLEGVWLEDYVLQQLQNIQKECYLDDIGMSFNFPREKRYCFF